MRNIFTCLLLLSNITCFPQKEHDKILKSIDANLNKYEKIAQEIWSFAEMGYQEENSSNLLQKTLKDEGFQVSKGVAGIPTAFVATFGSGTPIIAVLGEYDALPGLSLQIK